MISFSESSSSKGRGGADDMEDDKSSSKDTKHPRKRSRDQTQASPVVVEVDTKISWVESEIESLNKKNTEYEESLKTSTDQDERKFLRELILKLNEQLAKKEGRLTVLEEERSRLLMPPPPPPQQPQKRRKGYSSMTDQTLEVNMEFCHTETKESEMTVNIGSRTSTSRHVEFKWEKTELASMVSATKYLADALKDAGMPDKLKVFDITDKKTLFNVRDDAFPIPMSGTSDFIITVERTHSKTHAVELHRNTFLVIELKRPKARESLADNENQAFSLLMGIDSIQKKPNRLPVVVLTDLKEFIFCWIAKENQEKFVCYWSTENLQIAALLMSALAIEEARKVGVDVAAPQLPSGLTGLPIFKRCKLKDPPVHQLPTDITANVVPMSSEPSENVVSSSSSAAAPSNVASRHLMNLRGRQRSRRRDDEDDDFDDRYNVARQVYLSALRHFDTWSENPTFSRPLSPAAAAMYV